MPLLVALLISSFVAGVGTLSYSPPTMHSPTIYKSVKDQSRVINPEWPIRVQTVSYRYDPQVPKPIKKAAKSKKKKKVRHARR